jgi:hypothetical protein
MYQLSLYHFNVFPQRVNDRALEQRRLQATAARMPAQMQQLHK